MESDFKRKKKIEMCNGAADEIEREEIERK